MLRRGVSSEHAQNLGEQVASILGVQPEFERAKRIALYLALPDELPTDAVIELAYQAKKEVLVPRVVDEMRLEFVPLPPGEPLERGPFGVFEPIATRHADALRHGDLVLVPGVAFDRSGARLGRGAGYYDRSLGRARALGLVVWGLAYSFQLVDCVPQEAHDEMVAAVVTEEACHRFEK